jgi:hypothetical protein
VPKEEEKSTNSSKMMYQAKPFVPKDVSTAKLFTPEDSA